jgi:hypothetical protein
LYLSISDTIPLILSIFGTTSSARILTHCHLPVKAENIFRNILPIPVIKTGDKKYGGGLEELE